MKVLLFGLLLACGQAPTAATPTSTWRASSPTDASELGINLDAQKTWADDAKSIIGDMCPDAVLVWGDLVVDDSVRPRAVAISFGDDKPVLSGFLVCASYMEPFLKLQTANPESRRATVALPT